MHTLLRACIKLATSEYTFMLCNILTYRGFKRAWLDTVAELEALLEAKYIYTSRCIFFAASNKDGSTP